ncbi:MAG: hypothetical protein OXI05_03965 [Bacteroidota bacterium]|nr:hypothetical protein [Bacteroidota bacterium]MXW13629.1 hypothetical protein [Rhodothermaceae bacterium]MDE2644982.1 hypothetical protein [Bacteroidota bacterium]MXW33100.1 hypothetical protein [Rhodothermaceae bacterium]MXZ17929.1 hypothetical protein [Rhodothermaceae bacterium]
MSHTPESKRAYLDHSNHQLAEILLHSPYIQVSGKTLVPQNTPRLPQGLEEERKAYTHGQMKKELAIRLGSSTVADRMILSAGYAHLHHCSGIYLLRATKDDQTQIIETGPRQGVPVLLAKKYATELIGGGTRNESWEGWTISVLLEDEEEEIFIARLLDLTKPIKRSQRSRI